MNFMFDENAYNVITESLQSDIDMGMISYEYANIINDLSYSVYVENVETNENMLGILDKYIDRIMSYRLFESVVDVIQNITEAFNDNKITEAEHNALLEAVQDKFYEAEYCTEGTHQERRTISLDKKDYEKKIGVAVDNWERKVKYVVADSIKEAKKEAEEEEKSESIKSDSSDKSKSASVRTAAPKPRKKFHIDEDVIMKKLMPIGVALATAIGGLGLGKEISKTNKAIEAAQKRIATSVYNVGDIEVHDEWHRIDGISDDLKKNIYEILRSEFKEGDGWTSVNDVSVGVQIRADVEDGKKTLRVVDKDRKAGPINIRNMEKGTVDHMHKPKYFPYGVNEDKVATLETKVLRQKVKFSSTKLKEAYNDAYDDFTRYNREYEQALALKDELERKKREGKIEVDQSLLNRRTQQVYEALNKARAAESAGAELKKAYKKSQELEKKQNMTVEEYDKIINDIVNKMEHTNKDLSVKYDTK